MTDIRSTIYFFFPLQYLLSLSVGIRNISAVESKVTILLKMSRLAIT